MKWFLIMAISTSIEVLEKCWNSKQYSTKLPLETLKNHQLAFA
jgi:hypothetical protein